MKRVLKVLLVISLFNSFSCDRNEINIKVTNETGKVIGQRLIEIPATDILKKLKSRGVKVMNSSGKEIPFQITYDSLLIFQVSPEPGCSELFKMVASDSIRNFKNLVYGTFYPDRRDDIAYENELNGYRIYGPGTQEAGEKSYGYDLFFKHPSEEIILPVLYEGQTSERNWMIVDSLQKIDPVMAERFFDSFTYHVDHGKGLDCFAVGPSLGAGTTALFHENSVIYPWCYKEAEILDNGPLRFTLFLKFSPVLLPDSTTIIEKRLITLDSGSPLNLTKVTYEGLPEGYEIVAGFPLRDSSLPTYDLDKGILSYYSPTQGEGNGKVLLGLISDMKPDSTIFVDNHALLHFKSKPVDSFNYKWGYLWDQGKITDMNDWIEILSDSSLEYEVEISY